MALNGSRSSVAAWRSKAIELLKELSAGNKVTPEQQKRVNDFLEEKKE